MSSDKLPHSRPSWFFPELWTVVSSDEDSDHWVNCLLRWFLCWHLNSLSVSLFTPKHAKSMYHRSFYLSNFRFPLPHRALLIIGGWAVGFIKDYLFSFMWANSPYSTEGESRRKSAHLLFPNHRLNPWTWNWNSLTAECDLHSTVGFNEHLVCLSLYN